MNKIAATFHSIRLAGIPNVIKAISYTGLRDKLDAKFAAAQGSFGTAIHRQAGLRCHCARRGAV